MQIKVHEAKNLFEKIAGLMFKRKMYPLYLETRWGIHTFFIRQNLLILILDHSDKIVKIKDLEPNRIYFWNPQYKRVVELPKGTFRQDKFKVGQTLEIHF